jgi:ATP-dependent protease HslVU (ClpYQ) peptidase subunit
MTVAVAVLKNDVCVMAADSLVNFGGQRYPADNCRFNKIYHLGDSLMVWAGWSLYGEMLDRYLAAHRPLPALESEQEVFGFFLRFWRTMREDQMFMIERSRADGHPFIDLDSVFLLANRHGMFRVASDMDVTQFQQYCAIGSGAKYALGAMRVLYDQLDDAVEIARGGVQVGIDFDVYCGGPIDVAMVPSTTPNRRRATPRAALARSD